MDDVIVLQEGRREGEISSDIFCNSRDENYGLGAPNKGGLYLIDLNTGRTLATYIQPTVDGVFRREAGETCLYAVIIHQKIHLLIYWCSAGL